MLIEARTQSAKLGAKVEWVEGDVEALPFGEATFDVVLCQQSLQFFSDQSRAVQEMKRVLTPGGRFALNVSRALPFNPYLRALNSLPTPRAVQKLSPVGHPTGMSLCPTGPAMQNAFILPIRC